MRGRLIQPRAAWYRPLAILHARYCHDSLTVAEPRSTARGQARRSVAGGALAARRRTRGRSTMTAAGGLCARAAS
jgi:hypothetical protein